MKGLILEIAGKEAIVLLPGGEMRTLRAHRGWQTGMEIPVRRKRSAFRLTEFRITPRMVAWPAMALAALALMFVGFDKISGNYIDHIQPDPLSPGSVLTEPDATASPTGLPTASPTDVPTSAPTNAPTAAPTQRPTDKPTSLPTQVPAPPTADKGEKCDECGQYGHDDDDCPDQKCDECGQTGHDDDDCPYQKCDECGQTGHDDDDCPYDRDDDDDDDDDDDKHSGKHNDKHQNGRDH